MLASICESLPRMLADQLALVILQYGVPIAALAQARTSSGMQITDAVIHFMVSTATAMQTFLQ